MVGLHGKPGGVVSLMSTAPLLVCGVRDVLGSSDSCVRMAAAAAALPLTAFFRQL
jgi:hypothetical protein